MERMTIQELAKEMNVLEIDLKSFIIGLRGWTNSGFTLEKAIELHMKNMQIIVQKAHTYAEKVKPLVVAGFYKDKE